ncbi:MAG: hypothetical protein HWN67_06700 [Candidatus Helarchaeota archaeon]|nr:hypothetical protein [Candidatus Helarchaeota archaeon]
MTKITDTEEDVKNLILAEMAKQEEVNFLIILGIVGAIVVAIGITLWYFLHPRSPWVKRREVKDRRKDRDEDEAKRKDERRQLALQRKLQELDYTCKYCNAPGLKGPKCEYCSHINFSLD